MFKYEDYLRDRKILLEENQNLVGVVLNEREHEADRYLAVLKQEFKESCDNNIHYNMRVLKDLHIRNSRLYDFVKRLPKGADLHVHGTALVPIHYLIDFVVAHEQVRIDTETLMLTYEVNDHTFPLGEAFKKKLVSRKELELKWTVLGFERGQDPWPLFEGLFAYQGCLDEDYDVLYDYYVFAFKYYLSLNIYHVEIHVFLSSELESTYRTLKTIKRAYFDVKREDERLSVLTIGTSMKMFESVEKTNDILKTVAECQKLIKDDFYEKDVHNFVIGMDLVNEEDKSRPLIDYAELLINNRNEYPDMEYFLHCGESINAENDNLIDAYLIGAKRVGHGTNLYKYPQLLKLYADRELCLESCLISNQVLNYVKDLRLHPSAEYLKRGVTIALCSDDPIYFEYETLADDFFAAIVCWNLTIAEIKHLCINSIMYSGLSKLARKRLMKQWLKAWNSFIESCCAN